MDYSTVDFEVMESLDYLRPPVKRDLGNRGGESTVDSNFKTRRNKVEILRDFRKNFTNSTQVDKIKRTVESSTSFILKKSSKREILERYSIISYTSLLRPAGTEEIKNHHIATNKPVIKVTVIPKTEQTHSGKPHLNRKYSTKRVQSSVSNHENSIQTNNLYLVVAGRRKGKVYEIKTTGSAKFATEQIKNYAKDEAHTIKDISNVKQIIESLNMDKKKKKDKKKISNDPESFFNEESNPIRECNCNNAANDTDVIDVGHCKSRVRIFGRVGRTEDDRYVLKCGATVDDEPITTKFTTMKRHPSPTFFRNDAQSKFSTGFNTVGCVSGCSKNDPFRKPHKDSNIQVDFRNDNPYYQQQRIGEVSPSKESQGTQVNFRIDMSSTDKVIPIQRTDQTMQCNCTSIGNVKTISNNLTDNLKESQNPLVIISVYPKQESCDIVKTIQNLGDNTRRTSPRTKISKWENNNNQMIQSRVRPKPTSSRSPSPNVRVTSTRNRINTNDVNETKVLRAKVTTDNSNVQSTIANRNRITNKLKKNKQGTDTKLKQTDKKTNDLKNQQTQKLNCGNFKSECTKKPNAELKKAIVDDYTKRITAKMDHKNNSFKNDVSNVKININGENEYYDVLFQQGKLRTDLHIMKTVKEAGSQKQYDKDDSLENLFLIPEREPRKRSLSHALYNNPAIDVMGIKNRTSRLNVRDSIEIFHRRENVHTVKDTQTHESAKQNYCPNENTDFLAPIKHYKGDQCELPNPIERDKEIRELLGVENRMPSTSYYKNIPRANFGNVVEDRRLLHCIYKRKCEKNIETRTSLSRACECCKKKSSNCGAKTKVNATQYEPAIERTSLYQQLILNRNIQVFLQVEQFCKQKPIVLSRKQYDKVKKTIQKTMSKSHSKHKKDLCKCSMISVGEIRKRTKQDIPADCECDKQTQTDIKEVTECNTKGHVSKKNSERLKNSIEKKKVPTKVDVECDKKDHNRTKCHTEPKVATLVLFNSKEARSKKCDEIKQSVIPARQTVSSMEIHYASVAFMKQVTFSTTKFESVPSSSFGQRKICSSLHTIFKGHKKSPTPNLGTSVYSLLTNGMNSETQFVKLPMAPCDSKPRKPFLRRLMSCLVMRSRTSDVKICARPIPQSPSVNSSIDSYHISTSLGAIEVTSSMYDTSASFYSNHTILPIENNKMKRGFFSSVRGFLANRKS